MKYCKHCGKETKAKICPHCGSNSKKGKNFCGWCGHEVDQNAVVCLHCHEKLKEGTGAKIGRLISTVAAVGLLVLAVVILDEGAPVSALFCVIAAVLLLPFVTTVLRRSTFGSGGKRKVFSVLRVLAVIGCCVMMFEMLPEQAVQNQIYKDAATTEALKVFHDEVTLKNEASFVLNDSRVTYEDSYEGNDNLALVTVVLDYSAQNGFGGMNRDTYTVKLLFNYTHGTYRPAK